MFERYTEKARRVIFFARYEASRYGSREIATEHLFLGLSRRRTQGFTHGGCQKQTPRSSASESPGQCHIVPRFRPISTCH
jgi:hypothetical protein